MKTVLYLAEDRENAQFRYRCENVREILGDSDKWRAEIFLKGELGKAAMKLNRVDLVVIERQTDKDGEVGDFIRMAHAAGVRVLFDLDDLVFDYRDLPLLMRSIGARNVVYWLGYCWGIRRIAKKVDGFLVTNDFLGEKISRSFGKPYRAIRNSLNQTQLMISEKYLKEKKHDRFVMGYFSGSPTHAKDFAVAEPAVMKILREYDDTILNVVGYMKFSKDAQKLIDGGRIKFLSLVDFRKLQKLMSEVDVNIAPLVVNDFTNCKSELKFFEAAAVETTTIASPTYTFKRAIEDGGNGYLATAGEWYEKLEYLYKHPEVNKKVAKAAREYALKHYTGKEFLKEVEAAYDYFAR